VKLVSTEYMREYRKTETGKAATKRYGLSEKHRAAKARYRASERGRATEAEYRQSEAGREVQARWYAKPKAKALHAARYRKRRAIKLKAPGSHTADDVAALFKQQEATCLCGADLNLGYHIDHIMPLARGGSDGPENLQLLCPPCNVKKGSKTMLEWAP
jgi:5-methylcytosine-specific restriction endonuclease McrA